MREAVKLRGVHRQVNDYIYLQIHTQLYRHVNSQLDVQVINHMYWQLNVQVIDQINEQVKENYRHEGSSRDYASL